MDENTMAVNNVTLVGGKVERGDDITLEQCYEEYAKLDKIEGTENRWLLVSCDGTEIGIYSLVRVLFDKMDKILAKLEEKE